MRRVPARRHAPPALRSPSARAAFGPLLASPYGFLGAQRDLRSQPREESELFSPGFLPTFSPVRPLAWTQRGRSSSSGSDAASQSQERRSGVEENGADFKQLSKPEKQGNSPPEFVCKGFASHPDHFCGSFLRLAELFNVFAETVPGSVRGPPLLASPFEDCVAPLFLLPTPNSNNGPFCHGPAVAVRAGSLIPAALKSLSRGGFRRNAGSAPARSEVRRCSWWHKHPLCSHEPVPPVPLLRPVSCARRYLLARCSSSRPKPRGAKSNAVQKVKRITSRH
ncbi:uncharacterized protein [Struthio camelus]|uniref:uncharacterized protein n=1 Tax=Struthio camelus TaxID=8801 RepID=UPI003603EDD2